MTSPDDLSISKHAAERFAQRGITAEQIAWAIDHQFRQSPGEPGSIWLHGDCAGRTLKVCVRLDDYTFVITAAWADT